MKMWKYSRVKASGLCRFGSGCSQVSDDRDRNNISDVPYNIANDGLDDRQTKFLQLENQILYKIYMTDLNIEMGD